jgi:oligopeptide transport system substrate-binding protein
MLRLLVIPVALAALLVAAITWSGAARSSRADFVFINRGEIGTLDPNSMSWLQDIRMGYALWEGLYSLDPRTLEPVLGCAQRVEVSADKTAYTFHLRPDARWVNGEAVTADDFIFAWRRMLEEPGDYTYLLHYLKGAKTYQEQFAAGQRADFGQVGVQALGAGVLQVRLAHPVTFFADLCAFPPFFPLHRKSMEPFRLVNRKTGRTTYDPRFTRPPHLVGNGPYRLESWHFQQRLRLVASEHYWDKAAVRSRVIDMLSFADPRTAFLKYETGKVDWLAEVGADDAADLLARQRTDLRVFGGFGTYFFSLNCNPRLPDGRTNPLADVRVRQALAMVIDKKPIVDNVGRLNQPLASTFVPPGVFAGYRAPKGLPFDPPRARQLLAEAGYPGGRGFGQLSILFNKEGDHRFVAQIIRKQWLDHLGIDLELSGVEIKTFRVRLHGKDYAVARASWIGDYNDVSTFTDKYLSHSDNNDSAWKNPVYDQLCAQAAVEPDARRRLELLGQAEQLLCDQVPIIPLYHYVNAYLFRDHVRGVPLNPRNMVIFKALEARRQP